MHKQGLVFAIFIFLAATAARPGISFQWGGCPNSPTQLSIGYTAAVTITEANHLNLRSQPGLSGEIIAGIPKDASVTIVGGPACADGYRWYQISYQGMSGWSVEIGPDGLYSLYPVGTAMPDSSAPQQTSSLQTFACSLWSFFCPQETGARAWEFQKYQCTWYAAERRPDVYNWMPTYGVNARYWADIAAQNGIPVSSASDWTFRVDYDHVRPGDLVVFQPGCVSADLNYGHVAYVESVDYPNEIIHISEYNAVYENNYSERDMFIYWCMSFIH